MRSHTTQSPRAQQKWNGVDFPTKENSLSCDRWSAAKRVFSLPFFARTFIKVHTLYAFLLYISTPREYIFCRYMWKLSSIKTCKYDASSCCQVNLNSTCVWEKEAKFAFLPSLLWLRHRKNDESSKRTMRLAKMCINCTQ